MPHGHLGLSNGQVGRSPPNRRRGWVWWGGAALVALAVLTVGGAAVAINQTNAPPLALPPASRATSRNSLVGSWHVTTGSLAGFRLPLEALGMHGFVVGRSPAVQGTLAVSAANIAQGTLSVDLTDLRVAGRAEPGFASSMDVARYPDATLRLDLPMIPAIAGRPSGLHVAGRLTMRGVTRVVPMELVWQRSGSLLDLLGSMPVTLSSWNIVPPAGAGPLGSLGTKATAEFLVVMTR
jgi:hypothetical protein